MKVLFLCGGIGRRISPLTKDKFIFQFLGKLLLEHRIQVAPKPGLPPTSRTKKEKYWITQRKNLEEI
jgi:hypothetical protein